MFLHLNYDEYTCYFKAQTITVMFLYKLISGDSCQSPAFIDRNGSQLTTNNRVRLKASGQESVSYTGCRVPPGGIQNSPSLDSFTRHWLITAIVFINIVSVFHDVSLCPVFIIFNAYLNYKNMFFIRLLKCLLNKSMLCINCSRKLYSVCIFSYALRQPSIWIWIRIGNRKEKEVT